MEKQNCSSCGSDMEYKYKNHVFKENGNIARGKLLGWHCDECGDGLFVSGDWRKCKEEAFANKYSEINQNVEQVSAFSYKMDNF